MTDQQYVVVFFVAGTLLLLIFVLFIIAFFLIQKRIQYAHSLNILRAKIEEQEHALTIISRELHDNIKAKLGTSQMTLYRIADLGANTKQTVLIERIDKTIGEVISDVNSISRSLNSQFITHVGLVEAIKENLDGISTSKELKYHLNIVGKPFAFSPEKELNIFRIAQEAIQNCSKYARAKNLTVSLEYRLESFLMRIVDDGVGFDKSKVHDMKGLGFLNMFHRARYIQANIEVMSDPMRGCSITLTVNCITDEKTNNEAIA